MAIIPLNPDRGTTAVVFIDGSLTDLQTILSGLPSSVSAIILDPKQDGIQQMADALAGLNDLDAIHIIAHGSSGQTNLGATRLSQQTLSQYQSQLATIGNALSDTGDLLLYGCNVAQGNQGQAFISALANATGADVAASTDLTGNTLRGGNWQLEAVTGVIETNALHIGIENVLDANTIPSFTILNGTPAYTENGAAVVLDSDVQIVDAELAASGNYAGATLTLARNNGANAQDVFSNTGTLATLTEGGNLSVGGITIGAVTMNSYGWLILTFNGNATQGLVNSAMQQIAYSNNSNAPPASVQIDWTFDNGNSGAQGSGGALAATGNTTVSITVVNDAATFADTYGVITTSIGSDTDSGQSLTVYADGKILVAGFSYNGSNNDFALVRYNTDGSLDTGFDGDGKLTTAIGAGDDQGQSVALQADGKIVMAGYSFNGNSNRDDFALIRYNADGSLDNSFDNEGKVTTDFVDYGTGLRNHGQSVTIQANGKILVAGVTYDDNINHNNGLNRYIALARYNTDGSLDSGFSTDGMLNTNFTNVDAGFDVVVQPDGKILVDGESYNGTNLDFGLVRYNADGSLDTGFNADGQADADFDASTDQGFGLTLQANGKILVAGVGWKNGYADFALARYNADGSLDTGFSADGKVTTDLGGDDFADSVTVQADGKILVAGYRENDWNDDFALVRYNADGSLDTTFDTDGIVITAIGSSADASSVKVQADGKIVVAGHSWDGSNVDFALVRYNTDGSPDAGFGVTRFTEGGATVALDPNMQMLDAELAAADNYGGASLTLARNGGADAQDLFSNSGTLGALGQGGSLTVGGTAIGTVTANSGGTLTFTFNSSATQLRVNSALRQIAYSNSSDMPPASVQIDWTFNDGNSGAQGTGGALTVTRANTVSIANANDAPTGNLTISGTATQGQTLSAISTLADADGLGTIGYQWQANGVNISGATNSAYILTASEIGKTITVIAAYIDGRGTAESVTGSMTGVVAAANVAPTAIADTAATAAGSIVGIAVLNNDTDPNGGDTKILVSVTESAKGAHITVNGSTADYNPGSIFQSLNTGQTATDTFSYTMKDSGNLTSSATVTVTITGANDAPIAKDDNLILSEDDILKTTGSLLANDTDPDTGDLVSLVSVNNLAANLDHPIIGQYGKLIVKADGNYTYQLNNSLAAVQGLKTGQSLTETFSYMIKDVAGLQSGANINIAISGRNDTPVAHDDGYTYVEGSGVLAIKIDDLLHNDFHPDTGSKITFGSIGTAASGATLILDQAAGLINYNPGSLFDNLTTGQKGSDSFSYTLTDANGGTATGTVNLTVIGTNLTAGTVPAATGGSSADVLVGGADDSLSGGKGNDTYIIDQTSQTVHEKPNEGIDTVITTLSSYSLGDNIENLSYSGLNGFNGTGNKLNNNLEGNSDNDTLDGGAGLDNLKGGLGNDTYIIDHINDTVTEKADEGIDLIKTGLANYSLAPLGRQHIENLEYLGNNGVIANFTGTGNALNNVIIGNTGKDTLNGGADDDTLNGGANDDKLLGGDGNDILNGQEGNDSLDGGKGDDTLIASLGNDTLNGGEGADSLDLTGINFLFADKGKSTGFTVSRPDTKTVLITDNETGQKLVLSSIENYLFTDGSYSYEQLIANTASDLADTYTGNDSAETFNGYAGDDLISGGGGDDILDGGKGNDIVNGDAGNDSLIGGIGKDSLDGGTGSDTMTGGLGDDTYVVDTAQTADQDPAKTIAGDSIIEAFNAGTDKVRTSLASYTLGDNLEKLDYIGTPQPVLDNQGNAGTESQIQQLNFTGTGNSLDNIIKGGDGNDILDGGDGKDTLIGGAGNDTYLINNSNDNAVEKDAQGNDTGGIDTVQSSITYSLKDNLENLTLTGSANINGTGNPLDNNLTGNDGDNSLKGNDGTDSLDGGAGNDKLDGGTGSDSLIGGLGDDLLIYDSTDSKIDGGLGTDLLKLNSSGITLDLSQLSFGTLTNIEKLDLTGTGNNSLIVNETSLANLTGPDGHELYVTGNTGDSVTINTKTGALWEDAGISNINGVNYHQYIHITGAVTEHLYVLGTLAQIQV